MRAGGCSLQQGLTAEAAGVVKQAVTLARRRGHAQVTPLHVASTMLSSSAGLLRTACLQSHSHPLQCKALELCFNVALNRLPASNSSPMLGHHHHGHAQNPSISNALIAAFKRAQAHQRRGSIESQQQPLLAVKIEVEQLIISILDDPSVSRVMREAGFSSTQVKSNVEQAVSLEICTTTSHQSSDNNNNNKSNENGGGTNRNNNNNHLLVVKAGKSDRSSDEDVMSVVECLVRKKKKSVVVVGECIDDIEGVVRGVMEKVEKEDVPEGLRGVKFVTLKLSSLGNHSSRVEVEQKLGELKSLLRSSNCVGKGVILYLGDLKWTTNSRSNNSTSSTSSSSGDHIQEGNTRGYYDYCPKEHMIMEIGKLLCGNGIGEIINGRFWMMGIATFQTYMRCKTGRPSLEVVWGIHPLTIPAGSLGFSLLTTQSELKSDESTSKNNGTSKRLIVEGAMDKLTCCADCSTKFEAEARTLQSSNICNTSSTTSNLPAWLQQCRNDAKAISSSSHDHKNCAPVSLELYKKWNSYCYSAHQKQQQQQNNNSSEKTLITFSSLSPNSSSASGFSYDHHYYHNHNNNVHQKPNDNHHSWRDKNFWAFDQNPNRNEPSLRMYFPENKENNPSKQYPISSNPISASSSDVVMETDYHSHKFKELNPENLKTLSDALERKVPWQKDIIPDIASTILKCRSGMVMRKGDVNHGSKEETWLLFQGIDTRAKEKICKELARLIFGSHDEFVSIALSSFSSTRADSTEDFGTSNANNKRSRDEQSYCSYIERFGEAVSVNPHRVFLVEDVEQADYRCQIGFKRAMERGKIMNSSGEEVELRDAVVVLSCESFSSRSRACSPKTKQKIDGQSCGHDDDHDIQVVEETISPCLSLDLNISIDEQQNYVEDDDQSIDDIGLLESVDRRVVFKIQDL